MVTLDGISRQAKRITAPLVMAAAFTAGSAGKVDAQQTKPDSFVAANELAKPKITVDQITPKMVVDKMQDKGFANFNQEEKDKLIATLTKMNDLDNHSHIAFINEIKWVKSLNILSDATLKKLILSPQAVSTHEKMLDLQVGLKNKDITVSDVKKELLLHLEEIEANERKLVKFAQSN